MTEAMTLEFRALFNSLREAEGILPAKRMALHAMIHKRTEALKAHLEGQHFGEPNRRDTEHRLIAELVLLQGMTT